MCVRDSAMASNGFEWEQYGIRVTCIDNVVMVAKLHTKLIASSISKFARESQIVCALYSIIYC